MFIGMGNAVGSNKQSLKHIYVFKSLVQPDTSSFSLIQWDTSFPSTIPQLYPPLPMMKTLTSKISNIFTHLLKLRIYRVNSQLLIMSSRLQYVLSKIYFQ